MIFIAPTRRMFRRSLLVALVLAGAFFVFCAPSVHAAVEISDGSVTGLYHLENANDSSTYSRNLVQTNGSFDSGKLSNGFTSDASGEYLSATSTAWGNGSTFSMGFWLKPAGTNVSGRFIGKLTSPQSEGVGYASFCLAGRIEFGANNGGNCLDPFFTLTGGQWYWVYVTRVVNEYTLYMDNVAVGTMSVNANEEVDNVVIGAPDAGRWESAMYDEVFFTNSLLSSSTRDAIYNSGTGAEICVTVGCGTVAPSIANLKQLKSDATSTIAAGAKTDEDTVVFGAKINAASSSYTARLQVEVRPVGVSFTNASTTTSGSYSSGSYATTTWTFTNPGSYHWQARVLDSSGATSTWQLFGASSTSTDFIVDPADSVYFNGSSTWRWPATRLGFSSTDPFTIEFLYNTTTTSSAMQLLDTRSNGHNGFAVWKDAGDGGGINFSLDCGADATGTTMQFSGALGIHNAEGYWHHVAVSKKSTASSTDAFKLYFDGTQQTSGQCYTSTSTDSIWVPGNPSSSMSLFKGNVDELRIWKTERSSSDVATYGNQEVTSTDTNLLGYWRFNGTSTDLVTGNATSGQSGNPTFSTSTPFGHFLFVDDPSIRPWTSVNTSTYNLSWYNSSTQYLAQWVAGVNTWNASTSHAINIASTTATSSANLIVDDVNLPNSSFLARWNNLVGPPQEIQYNTAKLGGFPSSSLQHISTHELGHGLGLAHSILGNIMYPYANASTIQTTLGPQDKKDYEYCWGSPSPSGYCKQK